jgi:hypothetical protein
MLRDAILGINNSAVRTIVAVWEDRLEGMRKLIGKETTRATCQKYSCCAQPHPEVSEVAVQGQ